MLALIRVYHFPLISRDDALRTKQQERYEQKIAYLEGESRSDLGGFDWPWTYVDTRSSNRRALVAETRSESIFGPSMTARLEYEDMPALPPRRIFIHILIKLFTDRHARLACIAI